MTRSSAPRQSYCNRLGSDIGPALLFQFCDPHHSGRNHAHAWERCDLMTFALLRGGLGIAAHAEHDAGNLLLDLLDAILHRRVVRPEHGDPWAVGHDLDLELL